MHSKCKDIPEDYNDYRIFQIEKKGTFSRDFAIEFSFSLLYCVVSFIRCNK